MVQNFACPLGKCLPSCADSVNLGGYTLFNVDFERRKYTSARYTSAANTMSRDICISRAQVKVGLRLEHGYSQR
jgi:hypothetical protein